MRLVYIDFLDKFYKNYQEQVQRIIYEHSLRIVKKLQVVFYDMTTLYFETEDEDDLRKIVADSGLLSQSNIIMLSELGYEFIIGARIRNESDIIKKEIQNKLQEIKNNNHAEVVKVVKDKEFRLIVGYSEDRAKHDVYRRNKGVAKLRKKHNAGYLTKKDICNKGYNKFLSLNCNQIEVTIDENKIIQDEMWDGLKGYMTNSKMTSEEIQSNYSHLWQIEKAFRISKTDLRIRPIYHRKKNRIEAHICIVFATYAVFKELEIKLKNSKLNISVNDAVEY